MSSESLAESYFEELTKSNNPGPVLVRFFIDLFGKPPSDGNGNIYALFNRLVQIYGRRTIYFSLLDMADMGDLDLTGVSRLITYFAKKRLEAKFNRVVPNDLNPLAKKNMKRLSEPTVLKKIPDPFTEKEGAKSG
jgi:hypothetical protein